MIKVAAACFLGGAQAYMPPVILAVPSRAAQRRAILVTATPEKVDDAAAKLEALRAQVEAARQAAKESDYEWYLENAALLEGTERVASSPGDGRRTDAAPVPVASPVDAPAVAASQATTWDLTGSEVQTSELTSVEATAYRQFQAASSNNDAVNDAEWTADEADDVDPEFLSYDQGASVEVKPVEFDAAEYRSQQDEAVQKDERIAATLASLGYSAEEAASLVPDAVTMIVDLGFRRPQTTRLPADWTKSEPTQGFKRQTPRETSRSRSPETQAPPGRRRPSLSSPWVDDDDEDDDDDDDDVRARKGASTQRSGFLQNPYAIDNGEDCGDEYFDDDEDYDGDYLYSEDGGGDDDMSLYPSLDKFKEMLRAESNLRLTVAGPWIRDFVVTENRVRLALYKWWLKSLDEGIGDAPQMDRDLLAEWDKIDAEEDARLREQKALKAREEAEYEARRNSRARNRRRRNVARYVGDYDDEDRYEGSFDDYDDNDRFRDEGPSLKSQYRRRTAPPVERQPSRAPPRRRPPRSDPQSERKPRENSSTRPRRRPVDNEQNGGYAREGDEYY